MHPSGRRGLNYRLHGDWRRRFHARGKEVNLSTLLTKLINQPTSARNTEVVQIAQLRNKTLKDLFEAVKTNNIFDHLQFSRDVDRVLKSHQDVVVQVFKHGKRLCLFV